MVAKEATFPARLRQARVDRKMSIRTLAAAAEVCPSSVATYERDGSSPSIEICYRLSVALRVSPCWLAYGVCPRLVPAAESA